MQPALFAREASGCFEPIKGKKRVREELEIRRSGDIKLI